MRGLEKKRMKRDIQTHRQTDRRTSRLLDRIGPVGRFDENQQKPDIIGKGEVTSIEEDEVKDKEQY